MDQQGTGQGSIVKSDGITLVQPATPATAGDTIVITAPASAPSRPLTPPYAWAAWVGDSRLYLIREQRIYQLSEDHSVVKELVRKGRMTSEAPSDHEERNLVTRVPGGQRVEVAVWSKPFPVRSGREGT